MGITVNGKKVYWSKYNVGAVNTYDAGYYFSFAEIYKKTAYNASTQLYPDYGNIDPDSGHDAARENMGGTWRLPTDEEWLALRDGCDMEFKANYNGSGVDGIMFTSKTSGNSIFIPRVGYYNGTGIESGIFSYLSSTKSGTNMFSSIYTKSTIPTAESVWRMNYNQQFGYPVRPVCN
jgi:hypothetical protein